MRAVRLRTDYLDEPLGLGDPRPRLSWSCADGVSQSAYRISARLDDEVVWDSGKVATSQMTNVEWGGPTLQSRDRVECAITLWDESDAEGPATTTAFEIGLLAENDWHAQWIAGNYSPRRNVRYPVDHFRKQFRTTREVARARLYATALGVYDVHVNGNRVGTTELAPGSTDYRKRLHYQTYDISKQLKTENTIEFRLADGWFRGSVGAYGPTNVFGRQTKLLAQLEITYVDGSHERIVTDSSFAWSNDGPIRFADLKDGEVVDARARPSFQGDARVVGSGPAPTAADNVSPRTRERFRATLLTTPAGAKVLDFGQNIAGFVGFKVRAEGGEAIRLRLGEILDEHGEFTQANFQLIKPSQEFGRVTELLLLTKPGLVRGPKQPTPLQQIDYICAPGDNDYQTTFAVFGFRYALIDTELDFDPSSFEAIAVYSDMDETGDFECSNPAINQLVANARWSMKGNFLDVPTDCPTRERLGWTGDAQVFFDTAAYLMDVASFFRKWLRDLQDAQDKSGKVAAVVPYNGIAMMYDTTGGSVGWADAMVLIPYRLWKRYGDPDVIREFYPMMRSYADYMIRRSGSDRRRSADDNPFEKYVYEKGFHLGEWLEPDEFRDEVSARSQPKRAEEGTAYLHFTMTHLVEIATQLGHLEDARLYSEYAQGAKNAYNQLFVSDHSIDTNRQAKLVRPLALGLIDGETRSRVAARLVEAVEEGDFRVGTGFLSTAFLLPVLTDAGRPDIAYRMLENTESPSWLAEVEAGATTVWESWEGRESHNHYAPGAVCQWLFDTVAGITVTAPNAFTISPVPGGTLTHAGARYLSPYGEVESRWEIDAGIFRHHGSVPPNTTATVTLPNGDEHAIGPGQFSFTVSLTQ